MTSMTVECNIYLVVYIICASNNPLLPEYDNTYTIELNDTCNKARILYNKQEDSEYESDEIGRIEEWLNFLSRKREAERQKIGSD